MTANDNEGLVLREIMDNLYSCPQFPTGDEMKLLMVSYAKLERNRVLKEILSLPVSIHTSISDYCAGIRAIAERPYNAL